MPLVEDFTLPAHLAAGRQESPPPKVFQVKTNQLLRKKVVNHAHNHIEVLEQANDTIDSN